MGKKIWSNEKIDNWLLCNNKRIIRITDFTAINTRLKWKCLKEDCLHEWEALPSNVIKKNSGCPKCAGNAKISNESIDDFLLKNNILLQRIENVQKNNSKIYFKCLEKDCNYIWQITPNDIKSGYGCPKCAGNLPLTNTVLDQFLIDNNLPIKRLGDIINAHNKVDWLCLKCSNIWKTNANCIRSPMSGCPVCNKRGINEKLIDYYFQNNSINYISQFRLLNNNLNTKGYYLIDFYLPDINLFIEYNGIQHYVPTKFQGMTKNDAEKKFIIQQKRDNFIRQYCEENNALLLEIDGRKFFKNKLLNYINFIFIEGVDKCQY